MLPDFMHVFPTMIIPLTKGALNNNMNKCVL
jgi:hypothetical protein